MADHAHNRNQGLSLLLGGLLVGFFSFSSASHAIDQNESEPQERAILRTQLPGYMSIVQGSRAYRKGFPTAAAQQWHLAARWGHKQAQLMLALLYFEGNGVEKDWSRAHAWLTLSSSRGAMLAIENKDRLWSAMTRAEKQLAVNAFDELQPTYGDNAVLERLAVWYRKERHHRRGLTPSLILIPGSTSNLQIIDFNEKFGNVFIGEFFPAYDIQYQELQVIEPEDVLETDN